MPDGKETPSTAVLIRPPTEVVSFEELEAQAQKLGQFYRNLMQEGTDYGVIPGTQKPTLLKPGAELLRLWAGLSPEFEVDASACDVRQGFFFYQVRCTLRNFEGQVVGQASASCNNHESRYRYRWVDERDVPAGVAKDQLLSRQFENRKTGGHFYKYRIETDQPHDQANTILKIAEKRSFVGAILNATGASRIFTQDMEDVAEHEKAAGKPDSKPGQRKATPAPAATPPAAKEDTGELFSEDGADQQQKPQRTEDTMKSNGDMLQACFQDFGYYRKDTLDALGVKDLEDIRLTPWEAYVEVKQHAAKAVAAKVGATKGASA